MKARILAAVVLALCAACPTVAGFTRLDEMEDAEFGRYVTSTRQTIEVVASAAVGEGDIEADTLLTIAGALRGLADGTTAGVGGALEGALDLDSYGVAALTLAMIHLDTSLQERGAYDDEGALDERGCVVIKAVAEALEAAAGPQ